MIETVDSTTYRISEIGPVKANVTIGGSDREKFVPNINFSHEFDSGAEKYWYNVNAKGVSVDKERPTLTDDVMLSVGDIEECYRQDGAELKWIRTFRRHPGVNVWDHEVKFAPGVRFDYQGELTPWEIAAGAERPERVIGSYDVCCNRQGVFKDSGGKTIVAYRTGKMGSIYPPVFTDADGKTQKGVISIDAKTGLYRVSVDERWFSRARFPVVANDTFGNEAAGGSSVTINKGVAGIFSPSADGTVSQISAYLNGGADFCNMGYNIDESGAVGNHVAHGTSRSLTATTEWIDFAVSGAVTNATPYWLIVQSKYVSAIVKVYYASSGGNTMATPYTGTYDVWADDPTFTNYNSDYIVSIYATYATGGGGSTAITITDGFVMADSTSILAGRNVVVSDGVALSDQPILRGDYKRILSDGVVMSDGTVSRGDYKSIVSDGVIVSDSDLMIAHLKSIVSDGVSLSDSVLQAISQVMVISDGIVLSDSTAGQRSLKMYLTDGVEMSDAVSVVAGYLIAIQDGITMSDVITTVGGESDVTGLVTVTVTAGRASVTITSAGPSAGVTSAGPGTEVS